MNCNKKNPTQAESITVTDFDGNVYQTVEIGHQIWLAENLKVTHYRNGDPIAIITNHSDWQSTNEGACCSYDNDETNVAQYGRLYNWRAVNDSRKIAPDGWHVPSDADWKELEIHLGMGVSDVDRIMWRGSNEGSKLKNNNGWMLDGNGTNNSGYSALPGGYRYDYNGGGFNDLGENANFWTSTNSGGFKAWFRLLRCDQTGIYRNIYNTVYGFSIRLVCDDSSGRPNTYEE